MLLLLPVATAGGEVANATLPRIEAAFLRNFAHYVTWPVQSFADDRSPWRICVVGGDPFGSVLEQTFAGREEQGRSFELVRGDSPAALGRCHVVFIAYRAAEGRRAALAQWANRPVLTVSDAPGFLQEGGIIRLLVSDHVEFGVNLDQANAVSLKIPTKVLEVAHDVLENGGVRRPK